VSVRFVRNPGRASVGPAGGVARRIPRRVRYAGNAADSRLDETTAPAEIAEQLQIEEGAAVVRLEAITQLKGARSATSISIFRWKSAGCSIRRCREQRADHPHHGAKAECPGDPCEQVIEPDAPARQPGGTSTSTR